MSVNKGSPIIREDAFRNAKVTNDLIAKEVGHISSTSSPQRYCLDPFGETFACN